MQHETGSADPIILIPAAGAAARMRGSDKLLRKVDGKPQLRRIALAALATGCRVKVALNPDCADRRKALAGLDIDLLTVQDCDEGVAASLRTGAAVSEEQSLMIVHADMPELTAEDLARVVRIHREFPDDLLRAASGEQPGHPVLFPRDLVSHLLRLAGDTGAREIVANNSERLRLVPLPCHHALLDLDTPEDWARWEERPPQLEEHFLAGAELVPDPLADLAAYAGSAVLAVITNVEGTSYRDVGTFMAFFAGRPPSGSLTNGCIEGDLALHAKEVLATGQPRQLRYGQGSPFFDIHLPCGGGIDIGLFPVGDPAVWSDAAAVLTGRNAISISLGPDGSTRLEAHKKPGWYDGSFIASFKPKTRAIVFGDGIEAEAMTRLFYASGIQTLLLSSSQDQTNCSPPLTCRRPPNSAEFQRAQLLADPWTAVVTLYHDHDKEIEILGNILRGPAFYVGAQGSMRVAEQRKRQLEMAGVDANALAKLHGPAGLIRSTRDPQSLAVSILSEVVAARLQIERGF